ncbi:hypothetical protein AX774_g3365, partial [Zancudomyces culisetae]
MAYMTTKNRITQKSPAELLYGINLTTPSSWEYLETNENMEEAIQERLGFINSTLPELREVTVNKIVENKRYVASKYNQK